ncbi:Sugar transport protein 9 [Ananas comosus]|uniref:Sugar transport protein 9 n=1 Tax=Ananas comosus TaxID=4615 RepID=A0A199V9F0_ANACO|nr:Sugar transport protein 9 [Ananas comosus]
MSAVITGLINVFSTLVSVFTVDRIGRRVLFLQGSVQMTASQVVVGALIGPSSARTASHHLQGLRHPRRRSSASRLRLRLVLGPARLAGPQRDLPAGDPLGRAEHHRSPSHALHLPRRPDLLPMLCAFKFGLFSSFAAWNIINFLYIAVLLPETKGIPIEEMSRIWKQHFIWSRYVTDDSDAKSNNDAARNVDITTRSRTDSV